MSNLWVLTPFFQWSDDSSNREGGFDRGSRNWWRQQHYAHEFVGSNGVQSMAAVQLALKTLGVSLVFAALDRCRSDFICRFRMLEMHRLFELLI